MAFDSHFGTKRWNIEALKYWNIFERQMVAQPMEPMEWSNQCNASKLFITFCYQNVFGFCSQLQSGSQCYSLRFIECTNKTVNFYFNSFVQTMWTVFVDWIVCICIHWFAFIRYIDSLNAINISLGSNRWDIEDRSPIATHSLTIVLTLNESGVNAHCEWHRLAFW